MGLSKPEWKRIARSLGKELEEALDERDEAREQRDAAQLALEQEIARGALPIMVTEGAAAAIVEIRDLYAKDGTDEDLLRCALYEIRDARGRRISQAAIAMQSDALDAALARAQALEESVEISKQQTRDVEIERDDARAEIRRLKAWRTRAQEVEANHERAVAELVGSQEWTAQLEGEVDRLRGIVEEIALGKRGPATPRDLLEQLRDRLETSDEDPAQGVEESDRAWLIRRGWHSRGGTLDEWTRGEFLGEFKLFGTAAVAQHVRDEDAARARIAALPVLAYGHEFILEWKGTHRTKLFVHSYSWTGESGLTTIVCGPTPPGGEPA